MPFILLVECKNILNVNLGAKMSKNQIKLCKYTPQSDIGLNGVN